MTCRANQLYREIQPPPGHQDIYLPYSTVHDMPIMGLRSQALNRIARLSAKDCHSRNSHLRRLEENGQYRGPGKGVQVNGESSGIVKVSEVPMVCSDQSPYCVSFV